MAFSIFRWSSYVYDRYIAVGYAFCIIRARDNYRDNSDIDLTLLGQNIDLTTLNKIETEIDDLLLPWKFDLSIYHHIENPALIKVIDREGITFYP